MENVLVHIQELAGLLCMSTLHAGYFCTDDPFMQKIHSIMQ